MKKNKTKQNRNGDKRSKKTSKIGGEKPMNKEKKPKWWGWKKKQKEGSSLDGN
jgi:hypothetical protein